MRLINLIPLKEMENPCWKGYEMVGTKKKDGREVPNCVPIKEETIVEVELTTTQKKWYRSILERNFSWLKHLTQVPVVR